jgi:hypothetical protein
MKTCPTCNREFDPVSFYGCAEQECSISAEEPSQKVSTCNSSSCACATGPYEEQVVAARINDDFLKIFKQGG